VVVDLAITQLVGGPSGEGPMHASRPGEGSFVPTPLILLHGFTGDCTTWSRLAPHLGPGRPVLAVDLVGHGRSGAPRDPEAYTMETAVASVLAALDGLGIARAHWLGYSMGGRVALNIALAAPDRVVSLALIGASPGLEDERARSRRIDQDVRLARRIEREGLEAFVESWMAHPLFATQQRLGSEYLHAAREQRLRNHAHVLANTLRGMGTGAMTPLWSRLGEISSPALLVTGELDSKFVRIAAHMAERMPDARVCLVPASGHALHVEAPERLAFEVREFVRSLDAS